MIEGGASGGRSADKVDNPNPILPNGDSSGSIQRHVDDIEKLTVLCVEYRATTNRMLRVAVNGFMESLGVVLGVMEELDVDVLALGD